MLNLSINILIVYTFLLILPCSIYCDDADKDVSLVADSETVESSIVKTSNPSYPKPQNYFLPLSIASVVIIGVLVFALYHSYKTWRHY